MVEGFINEDPMWLLFTTDLNIDNLVVEESGQVFLRDLSQVMLIDKDTLHLKDENADHYHNSNQKAPFVCDGKCFTDFYDELVSPKGADNCAKINQYAGHMYTLVCQNVFQDHEGLLHSLDKDEGDALGSVDASLVKTLISKCARSSDLNARESSAISLLDMLSEDDDDNDDEEAQEVDDDHEEDPDIGDEDLGEDQYAKTHDEKVVKTKDDKYDFEDGQKKHKDMQFP